MKETEKWLGLLVKIFFLCIAGYLIFTRCFLIMQAAGNEMFPAVKDGDLVIAYRLQGSYVKNDVVVYVDSEGRQTIGRVMALEGDVVSIDEEGTLKVNGTEQNGEIVYPTYPDRKITYPFTVPAQCCFILDDYRIKAQDSRSFGAVSMEAVKGKVITILRRRGI